MAERITKETIIAEALRLCPEAAHIFRKHGMECNECLAASTSNIEQGALMHDEDAQAIVDELNAALEGEGR